MIKIAISGKANSGKDTLAKLCLDVLKDKYGLQFNGGMIKAAFADPIKEIIKIMFPRTKRNVLYGPSKNRSAIVEGAYKDGIPLTYRTLLQDLGTEVGRGYKESIWLDILDFKSEKAEKKNVSLFIIVDTRFRNEFDHVKKNGYITIRIKRDSQLQMTHASELEQELINDSEFDYVIDNNGTLDDLRKNVIGIFQHMS